MLCRSSMRRMGLNKNISENLAVTQDRRWFLACDLHLTYNLIFYIGAILTKQLFHHLGGVNELQ